MSEQEYTAVFESMYSLAFIPAGRGVSSERI